MSETKTSFEGFSPKFIEDLEKGWNLFKNIDTRESFSLQGWNPLKKVGPRESFSIQGSVIGISYNISYGILEKPPIGSETRPRISLSVKGIEYRNMFKKTPELFNIVVEENTFIINFLIRKANDNGDIIDLIELDDMTISNLELPETESSPHLFSFHLKNTFILNVENGKNLENGVLTYFSTSHADFICAVSPEMKNFLYLHKFFSRAILDVESISSAFFQIDCPDRLLKPFTIVNKVYVPTIVKDASGKFSLSSIEKAKEFFSSKGISCKRSLSYMNDIYEAGKGFPMCYKDGVDEINSLLNPS